MPPRMCCLVKLGKDAPSAPQSGCRHDQALTSHLQEIVAFEACPLGVMTSSGSNQMQVVLNLWVPTLEAILVQWMVVSCISSLGRDKQATASVPPLNLSALRVNNSLKQGLRS